MKIKSLAFSAVLYPSFLLAAFTDLSKGIPLEDLVNDDIIISTKQIHLQQFPDAHNPSFIRYGDGYLMVFRYCPNAETKSHVSFIGIAQLDKQFQVVSEPKLLFTRKIGSKTSSQSEDPRIFRHEDKIYVIYNDNIDVEFPGYYDRRDIFIAEVVFQNNEFKLLTPFQFIYPEKHKDVLWQKNWMPFEWNQQLLLSYSINPHLVLQPDFRSETCSTIAETDQFIEWPYGNLRGSSCPQLVDDEYLGFFHSGCITSTNCSWNWELWHYFMGAYTFSASPPFQVTKISPYPLVADGFYTESENWKRVVFPGGFVVEGNLIYLAYGKDDSELWVATINKDSLIKSLVSVK